ncbi:PAS domain S-box protein [Variovorax sp. YR216]|uniref:PAS domain S-box protein n=1 Tax=Variovorax sp. YR216 TaxID=1882828 RepID=UPI00089B9B98|nr:PAS domain S-box protein [Variovorax sp. YR216]SEA55163.1 PAS domain S-box-containing protein [Variovorax sp. YR216]
MNEAPEIDEGTVFRSLFAAYPDALLLVDLQGVIRLANPAALALLGYETDELLGQNVDALVPDAIRPRHAAYRDAYAAQPRARPMGTQMDLVARRRDGREVMVEIALSPLQDHGLPYVVAAIRNVTEYPRVKQALLRARYAEHLARFGRLAVEARESERLLAEVPAVAADALHVEMAEIRLLEPDGLRVRVAAAIGPDSAQRIGQRLPIEVGSALEIVLTQGRAAVAGDSDGHGGVKFQLTPSDREAGVVCKLLVPLADRGRTIGALAVRSCNRYAFGEDELNFLQSLSSMLATVLQRASSEDALTHAQRLESVGQLTGGIAHDFNNLLTVISGNLQILRDVPQCASDPLVQPLVDAAIRATQRGAELTAKLLAFSRRQVLQPTVVDLGVLLRSLTGMLRRTLDQRIAIELDVAVDLLCTADPMQLESALLNVALNARDAMPNGGTLRFNCHVAAAKPPELESWEANREGYIALEISDTGEGMPEAVRERAFEPFFTTKESGRGTGLGLSTVYGFARQSKGAATLDSAPGQGTTVTLFLPRVGHGDVQAERQDASPAAHIPKGLKVLLVEDDPEVVAVVRQFLTSMDLEVLPCANGEQALQILENQSVDLLLTDVFLGPGLRGTEVAAKARRRHPGLPVLLMSGYSRELLEERNGWEVLAKPYTRAELERAIGRVLSQVQ